MAIPEPPRLPPASTPARTEGYRFRNLWQVPVFLLGLTALVAVWITRPWWNDPRSRHLERTLESARVALDDGRSQSLNDSLALLSEELAQLGWFPRRAAEVHFLFGSICLRQADNLGGAGAGELCRQALAHLQQAEGLRLPEADRPLLDYRLGKALYRTGAEPKKVIAYLSQEVIESMPVDRLVEGRFEGYGMLALAYLKLNNRQAALQANERQLQLPILDQDALFAPVRLLRGELLWDQDRAEARKVLARIQPDAPPAVLSRARFLLALGYQQDSAWSNAAELWQRILADGEQPAESRPQILFYLGWCFRHLERSKEAVQIWQQLVAASGEEAQAASLRLGELRLEAGGRADALELYERALAGIAKPEQYHNRLVTLAQAQELLATGSQACLQAGAFPDGLRFIELYSWIGHRDQTLVLRSAALEAWALAEQKDAAAARDPALARQHEDGARKHLREAAAAYRDAAETPADNATRIDRLWHAGKDYLQGQDFASALVVLERYIQVASSSEHIGEAYYRMGEAYQALNRASEAARAYHECIGLEKLEPIPKSRPFTFRARYQLALAERKRGDAEEMLRQNLELMRQGPDPEAEEESLFTLAELLFLDKNYSEARIYWEQALSRYPSYTDRAVARFRLGECYRHLADEELKNLRNNPLPELRHHSQQQHHSYLERALANYEKVATDLLEAQRAGVRLSATELEVLELARVAKAQCFFYLGDYRAAIPLYNELSVRYQGRVEGLVALQQQWFCYFLLPDRRGAAETLTSMRLFLAAMDHKAFAGQPPTQSRKAFEAWISKAEEDTQKLSLTNYH